MSVGPVGSSHPAVPARAPVAHPTPKASESPIVDKISISPAAAKASAGDVDHDGDGK